MTDIGYMRRELENALAKAILAETMGSPSEGARYLELAMMWDQAIEETKAVQRMLDRFKEQHNGT